MTFSEDQFRTLSRFEAYFTTAVNSDWARHPGQAALQVIHEIFTQATGDKRKLNGSCQSCILHLLQDCGRLYFADKDARSKAAVVAAAIDAKPKRVAVKIKKAGN